VTRKRWFLPETPDVLGMLRRQMAVTIDGVDAFARWAAATRRRPRPCATPSSRATSPSATC
jgi:hypothetical protein